MAGHVFILKSLNLVWDPLWTGGRDRTGGRVRGQTFAYHGNENLEERIHSLLKQSPKATAGVLEYKYSTKLHNRQEDQSSESLKFTRKHLVVWFWFSLQYLKINITIFVFTLKLSAKKL